MICSQVGGTPVLKPNSQYYSNSGGGELHKNSKGIDAMVTDIFR